MTTKFLADENLKRALLQALIRCSNSTIDIVRAQQVGLSGVSDPEIIAWAATEGRVILTRDFRTVPKFAYERLMAGLLMAGIIVIDHSSASIGRIVEDILLLAEFPEECEGQVRYVPF